MTIKARHRPAFIVVMLFWLYFSGLSNKIIRKKYLLTGDWSQSAVQLYCVDAGKAFVRSEKAGYTGYTDDMRGNKDRDTMFEQRRP